MSKIIQKITNSLEGLIEELSSNPSLYLRNPNTDFSRDRKIDFKTFVGITFNSGGCTMSKELLDYFDFNTNTPTVSAYCQQRSKVLPDAFEYLFHSFTEANLINPRTYDGYRLIACDGSNLTIPSNKHDYSTLKRSNQSIDSTGNHLHLNAFYDVLNRVYVDTLVQKYCDYNESNACVEMLERSRIQNVILVADRNYEFYNLIAHATNKNWKYVIRIKNSLKGGIASGLVLPDTGAFDKNFSITFSRKNTKQAKEKGYKYLSSSTTFDYLPRKSNDTYTLAFRIARFAISDDTYEMVITNLDKQSFPIAKLKEIYKLRWGIETSFRELKYSMGLTNFHSKKVEYIEQEIYSRLLLYNYCELITAHVVENMKKSEKTKQVNFTVAISICREFFRKKRNLSPPDVIKLIEKYTLPLRPGRKDPRKVKTQSAVSFLYRVA